MQLNYLETSLNNPFHAIKTELVYENLVPNDTKSCQNDCKRLTE
ncbi:MAG: hypothetical protein FD155_1857 [Bacteroidetes bacterium]|nr:MAG: hypothetical protein FD155_1857 [Bacteroidota bacterium]